MVSQVMRTVSSYVPSLADTFVGRVPQPTQASVAKFGLDKASIMGQALYLDTTDKETADILGSPRFFKVVVADLEAELNSQLTSHNGLPTGGR